MDFFATSKQNIMECIEAASEEQITQILFAILKRQEERFPGYEMIVFSLPRYNRMRRKEELDKLRKFLMRHCCDDKRET